MSDSATAGDAEDITARRALAKSISTIESGGTEALAIEQKALEQPPSAHVLGITGPPGAGKSSLISALLPHALAQYGAVAILAGEVEGQDLACSSRACYRNSVFLGQGILRKRIGIVRVAGFMRRQLPDTHQDSTAFCACSLFSASSKTADCGPSMTASVISMPRQAGRQCITTASPAATASSSSFSWKG